MLSHLNSYSIVLHPPGLNTKPQQNGHTISGVSTPDTEYTTVTTISEAGARYLCHVERDGINMVNLSVPKGRGRLNTVGSISRQVFNYLFSSI